MRFASLSSVVLFAIAGSACAGPVSVDRGGDGGDDGGEMMSVFGCFGDAHGNLSGQVHELPMDGEVREFLEAMDVVNQGVVDNRVDLVFVGDGYRSDQMGQYHSDVAGIVGSLFAYEPFTSYQSYFRISEIEVISNQSGVDNDPSQGVMKDTALDMQYWCNNTERLLCVNVGKAYTAAAAAPDIDQVIAISNSSKYGGAGYPSSNLGTAAGHNNAAADIAIHELGHSLGDLADEYTYGGPTTYTGGELTPWDVSIYNRQEQIDQERKWHYWMGASIPGFDNPVSAYEGANYSQFGVFRPSGNSMMRSLGRPFNVVSAERLLRQIYKEVNPIDDGTPDGALIERDDVAWVSPMQPSDHDLLVFWYLDDWLLIQYLGAHSIDIASLTLEDGEHELRVEVIDGTNWIRKESLRDQHMTEVRTYTIAGAAGCVADLTGEGDLNFLDVSAFLTAYGNEDPIADFVADGEFNFFDVSAFLVAFGQGCP